MPALAALMVCPVLASGPYIDDPDFFATPFDQNAIVAGTEFSTRNAFSQTLLYLHLSGEFSAAHRTLFDDYLERRSSPAGPDGMQAWRQRLESLGLDAGYISTKKWLTKEVEQNGRTLRLRSSIDNCLSDAFATASATFDDRLARYGADSVPFRRWLEAQQQVFANCGSEEASIPAAPGNTWAVLERQDREYQIAASYFYNLDYLAAAERFRAIADDPASPWADVARYLVARSLVREALTLENEPEQNLRTALGLYRDMADDPDYLARFPSVTGMIRMIGIRQDRTGFVDRLGAQILQSPQDTDPAALDDYLFVIDKQDDSGDGVLVSFNRLATDQSRVASEEILSRWRDTGNPAWLWLALERTYPAGGRTLPDDVLAAVGALEQSTPGAADMRARAAERLVDMGEAQAARELAVQTLAQDDLVLSAAHRNRLQYVLARSSQDPYEYLRLAQMRPVAMQLWPNGYLTLDQAGLLQATRGATLFTDDTVAILNDYFTPAMLLEAVRRIDFNDYLRGRLLIAAWVRAMLLDDETTARQAAPLLAGEFPDLKDDFDRYVRGEDSDFVAARLIVDHPGFSPWMPEGIGRYRREGLQTPLLFPSARVALPLRNQNWWCAQTAFGPNTLSGSEARLRYIESLPFFGGLNESQRMEMAGMRARLEQSATEFFGPLLIDYAASHRDDASVPQALHRLVFATRYACEHGPGEISQAAFSLLHRNYPESDWAEKTPFWYD